MNDLSPLMKILSIALMGILALSSGCTYYQLAPATYVTVPTGKFDRSWSAAVNAFEDQGVTIIREDRESGVVRGTRDGMDVSASVRTRADGSVRVQFDTSGATGRDPKLIERISRSYDRRMGR